MQKRLPVEIGVLCTYIEHLCASAVVSNRAQGTGSLHDVTLPRSWLSKALANFSLGEAADKTIDFWLFPPILGDLIKDIYTGIGAGMLKFNVLPITDFLNRTPVIWARIKTVDKRRPSHSRYVHCPAVRSS